MNCVQKENIWELLTPMLLNALIARPTHIPAPLDKLLLLPALVMQDSTARWTEHVDAFAVRAIFLMSINVKCVGMAHTKVPQEQKEFQHA